MSIPTVPRSILPDDEELLGIGQAARLLGEPPSRVRQRIKDETLLAVGGESELLVPASQFTDRRDKANGGETDGRLNRFVPGLITVLRDGGFRLVEIAEFLYTPDESLPGRPIDALHGHLAREVMRRAQAMAL